MPAASLALAHWRLRFRAEDRFSSAGLGIGIGSDRAIDLGDRIGSRHWWLGCGACLTLIGSALALASLVPALPELSRPAPTPAQREANRPQTIAPLARGGATGAPALANPGLVEPLAEPPERPRVEGNVRFGGRDSLESALRRAGVGREDLASVRQLLAPVKREASVPSGNSADYVLGRRPDRSVPRPLEQLGLRTAFDMRVMINRSDGALQLKQLPISIDHTPLRVVGSVGSNLQRALRSAGLPATIINDATKALGYVVDFQHGVGKRDRFDLIVAQDRAETGETRQGDLLYVALRRDNKDDIELARPAKGGGEFFKANGESAKKGLMKTPVDGARLTSGFGMRFHPLLAFSRMHQGVDFGAPSGSPIMAAASGTIAFAGPHGGHGNYVLVKHTRDLNTGYAHMSRFAVKPGQHVAQGQVIGYVGSTGLSTGPHLHYEVWLRGQPVNPVQLKFIGGSQLAGAEMSAFRATLDRLRGLAVTGGAARADALTPLEKKRATKRG